MTCILLTGGHAAGKTTALKVAQEKHGSRPGWRWIYADHEIGGDVAKQYKTLNRIWGDPTVPVIIIEGVRVYSTVFRCARFCTLKRELWVGVILQEYEVGREHIRQRCERSGGRKKYRASFWDRGAEEVGHMFKSRYVGGVNKFLRENPQVVVQEVAYFTMDLGYAQLAPVGQWLNNVLGGQP